MKDKDALIIEKQKEFIKFLQNKIAGNISNSEYITGDVHFRKAIRALESPEKSAKKDFKKANIKICAGCGSFAHGNPGHDITI